jgi:hypothetical protein
MIVLSAREDVADLESTCFNAVDLCNRLGVGIDLDFKGHLIEARPGAHPYNLAQTYKRENGL